MNKKDAIKYLQQLYQNGGHCWLDEQRIEAIGMAVKALKEEPAPKIFEDMLNAKTPAESLSISPEEHDKIVDECLYGKEPELVDFDDMPLDPNIQYASREIGIKAHAEDYSFNIESELFQQLNKEQQELWRKEIEQACMSGGYCGLNLGLDKRYDKKEPVSEDFENALAEEWKGYNDRGAAKVDALEDNTQELAFAKGFYRGWHYMDDNGLRKAVEGVSEELSNYINELSKQFPEVSFAKLSRIAVRAAKWQEKQDQSTIELAEDHAMLAGMNKMEQHMIEKAVETTFNVSLPSGLYDKLLIKGCKEGDKLLVIKKDEL